MKTMPDIGTKVRYQDGDRSCTGIITAQWPAFDGQDFVQASIKVDTIPDWWPYPQTDVFAPEIKYIEVIK